MNLQERHVLPKLWLYSFVVTFRALPKLLCLLIAYVVIGLIILKALSFVFSSTLLLRLMAPFFMTNNKVELIIRGMLLAGIIWCCTQLYLKFFVSVGVRLLGQTAENKPVSFTETSFASIKPAFYSVVSSILYYLPVVVIAGLIMFFTRKFNPILGTTLVRVMNVILFFVLYIRWTYSQAWIFLRDAGPVEGLVKSWQMTRGMKYIDTLLMWIMFGATMFVYIVGFIILVAAARVIIPLYLANWFDLSHTVAGWVMLLTVGSVCALFCVAQVWTFLFNTFLNRYYTNEGDTLQRAAVADPIPQPLPVPTVEIPNLKPVVLPETHIEEGLPRKVEQKSANSPVEIMATLAEEEKISGNNNPYPAADIAAPSSKAEEHLPSVGETDELENLQLSQSSVNTSQEAVDEIDQHLNKVYTPSKDGVVQYGDEDRMPTILFDDEMAKQLEETDKQLEIDPKKTDSSGEQDPGSIKMSK